MVFVLWPSVKDTLIEYKCPIKKSIQIDTRVVPYASVGYSVKDN